MPSKVDREPVVAAAGLQTLLQAAIQLAVSFGLPLTALQQGLITTLALGLSAYWVRGKVFAPVDASGQPITAVTPDQFATIAAQMGQTGTTPPPTTMNVISDPASPRLQPPPPATGSGHVTGQGMTNKELIELIQKSERKHPTGEAQARVP